MRATPGISQVLLAQLAGGVVVILRQHADIGIVEKIVGTIDGAGRHPVTPLRQQSRDGIVLLLRIARMVKGESEVLEFLSRHFQQGAERRFAADNPSSILDSARSLMSGCE